MTDELSKKAIEMLLKGATLLAEPCPYCKGVRVMKDGHAFCVSCGREPEQSKISSNESKSESSLEILEQKLATLSKELKDEKEPQKQQEILKSINSLIELIEKLKKLQ